jgi:hypothetical protein
MRDNGRVKHEQHPRFTVGLSPRAAKRVRALAAETDVSISGAIAALIDAGLEERARKQQFVSRVNKNLANTNPTDKNRMVDEFRALILGKNT